MRKLVVLLSLIAVICLVVNVFAQDAKKADAKYQYIGVKKCKMCHKGPKKGNIFEKWQSAKHSKAFATLATDQAKKIAKEKASKAIPSKQQNVLFAMLSVLMRQPLKRQRH